MAQVVHSAFEALLFLASLYGWGSLVGRGCYGYGPSGWAYPSALGIAFLIAVGGVLNAAGIAKPMVLLALMAAGLGLAICFAYRFFSAKKTGNPPSDRLLAKPSWITAGNLVHLALVSGAFFFLVTVLMPARTFNLHDDFYSYLMWPLRMLQTGSLGGNPFDHLGVSSLGGQAFMQGMYLTFGKIAGANVFDAILCLVLTLGLLKELGEQIGAGPVFTLLAGLLAVFINPHYVNISSLYSGSLMLLGLVSAHLLLARTLESRSPARLLRFAVPCALFYAALLTLKTTHALVVLSFWGVCLLGSLALVKERKQTLLTYLSCALLTIFLLVPWISLYWDSYLRGLHYIFNDIGYPADIITGPSAPGDGVITLLSSRELAYGNSPRDYLSIVGMLLFASVATAWSGWKGRNRWEPMLLLPLFAVFLSAIISYYAMQFCFGPVRIVVRYSCPILIGSAPVAVLVAGWLWRQGKDQTGFPLQKVSFFLGVVLLGAQLALIGMFQGTFADRIQRAASHRTLLSFPLALDDTFKQYNDYVLGEKGRRRMSNVQAAVPAGETIFAWASTPFLLDFMRNPIYTINEASVVYNLLVMPLAGGVKPMLEYFRQFGIRYVLWDYRSYGMKGPEQMGSLQNDLIAILQGLIPGNEVLYNDGQLIVFDIGKV